jgi:hypothetical protein
MYCSITDALGLGGFFRIHSGLSGGAAGTFDFFTA